MRTIEFFKKALKTKDNRTKILLSFSRKLAGDDFDPYSKNYTVINLNPLTIFGIVTDIKPEKLVYQQYGLMEIGAKEVLVEERFTNWFRLCNKITIEDAEYCVYKEGLGNNLVIHKLPNSMVKITIFRK